MFYFIQNVVLNQIKNIKAVHILFLILFLCIQFSVSKAQDYKLVWSDEFNGTVLDTSKWSYQIGNGSGGWGNNEKEYYRSENAVVDSGYLTIIAKKENYNGFNYTSARIRTIHKGDWKYGKFEIRAKMPIGQGMWPAFWMMPTDNVYGGWAASGEIDIMEYLGNDTTTVYGTLHYGGAWPNNVHSGQSYTLNSGFYSSFHTYTLIWEEGKIQWLVDDHLYQTQTSWYTSNGSFPAPFDQKFHILLNLAVGGNWPGYPDTSTKFPQKYVIDYVRVYQKTSTSVKDVKNQKPLTFSLRQNYPNPFNPSTSIRYGIAKLSYVNLSVYNILGKKIKTLINGEQPAGNYSVDFNASNLSSGIYFYKLTAGNYSSMKKMILLK